MQSGDKITFGIYDWLVLDIQDDKALLITESIAEQRPFHNSPHNITWADCELRAYLNGEFYGNFSDVDKSNIITVKNTNPDNEWYGSSGGEDTQDRIFLLSIEEVTCKYFGNSSALLLNPSEKQRYWFQRKDKNNVRRRARFKDSSWWWWLRSPGRTNKRGVYIHGDGNVGIQGNSTFKYGSNTIHPSTGDNSGGVRPTLWMKITDNES